MSKSQEEIEKKFTFRSFFQRDSSRRVGPEPDDSNSELETLPENDKYWGSELAFQEQNFASNFKSPRKAVNLFWAIAFYANLILSITLYVLSKPTAQSTFNASDRNITLAEVGYVGVYSIVISFGFSLFNLLSIWSFPTNYVKFSVIVVFILICIAVLPFVLIMSLWILLFSVPVALILLFFLCKVYGRTEFSAALMRSSVLIIRKFPSILIFNMVMLVIQSAISYIFTSGAVLIYAKGISFWVYFYAVFSYFWISQTITYFTYTTVSGVACAWYFLNETDYMPRFPMLFSFGHSLTSNFGPSALAGFLQGTVKTFNHIKKAGEASGGGCIFCCLGCCVNCICCCITFILGAISQYSLVYTAMFGTSAKEGVKRWKKISSKKIINMIVNTSIVGFVFSFYSYCGLIIGAGFGLFAAYLLFNLWSPAFFFMISTCALCTFNGLLLVSKPVEVLSDTLFIGFAELPGRLKTGASELYELFNGSAKDEMDKEMSKLEP